MLALSVDLSSVFETYGVENDGLVDFVWLQNFSCIEFSSICLEYSFLEVRLGYPQTDLDKIVYFKSDYKSPPFSQQRVRKGWHSYFVKLPQEVAQTKKVVIEFNKSLDIAQDSRFLGAMLSYCFMFKTHPYMAQVEALNVSIDECLNEYEGHDGFLDIDAYLTHKIKADESNFYAVNTLKPMAANAINHGIGKYSVMSKREVWLDKHIASSSRVLDVGCGFGGLAFLTKRDIKLYGVDVSDENVMRAKAAGYQDVVKTSACSLPFPDHYFDYVVSLDVFGHIALAEKDLVMSEMARVLKPNGCMLHGIEVDDFNSDAMGAEDFLRMVLVDGHIGIETRSQVLERFTRHHFVLEDDFLIGNCCMSVDHWIRAHYLYGTNLAPDVALYFLNLNAQEKQAFDIGVGKTFWALRSENYDSRGTGGLFFVRARKVSTLM
ncbi:MAG: class I SAM-dependent methyltransferase [Cyanobacteria bacterium P01_D01_bin.156]